MPKKVPSKLSRRMLSPRQILGRLTGGGKAWLRASFWHRVGAVLIALVILLVSGMYGIGQWYVWSNRHKPIEFGTTFVPKYAKYFGQDPQEVMTAMVDDLGFRRFRLVSYWSEIEKKRGIYDFRELDWQFKLAEEKGLEISLSVGLRQPRWPECHMPKWASRLPKKDWYPELKAFTKATVERYKNSPALESYQLENEYLLKLFGRCPDHDRERLIDEFNFVKSLDSTRPLIVNRSDNATPSWPVGQPRADAVGIAIYKRVWDQTLTKRYFEYPFPSWYYSFMAGGTKLTTGKETFIHELQTEPWLPPGYNILTASTEELYKSFNPELLPKRLKYAADTGMKQIDVWGVEWWYYMKEERGAPELWDTAKTELAKYR